MNTLKPILPRTHHFHRPMLPKPLAPLSFKPPLSLSFSIKASSFTPPTSFSFTKPKTLKPQLTFLKPTLISTITATALFFTGFSFNTKTAISSPVSPPPSNNVKFSEFSQVGSDEDSVYVELTPSSESREAVSCSPPPTNNHESTEVPQVGSEEGNVYPDLSPTSRAREAVSDSPPPTVEINVNETVSQEGSEEPIEEGILSNPNKVEILRNLLENSIKNRKLVDAVSVLDKLIELEPDETEWYFLKAHIYVHKGEFELAKVGFRKVVSKDPYHVEAYRGLVMAVSQDDSGDEMKEVEEKVEDGIKMCKEENKEGVLRDFKLLLAQIWVIEGKYDDALKVYEELVDDEPMDYRPYLCQGLIYTVLKKFDEAEKYLEKYRGLVPQEDPNARFEFMMAT